MASKLSHFDITVIRAKKSEIIRPAASKAFLLCQNAKRKKGENCHPFMVNEKRLDFMSFMSVECSQPAKSSVVHVGTKVYINRLQRKGI